MIAESLVIVGFLVVLFFLGFSFLSRTSVRFSLDELLVMSVGVGLAVLPLLLWLVRLILPLTWYVVVAVVLIICYFSRKSAAPYKFEINHFLMVLLIAVIHFAVFLYGSFQYTYLEDSDPLYHAVGAWQVARTHAIGAGRYLEPYPPFYDILMGLLVQLTGDAVWTLKVVNSLLVSLGILFAFYAAREFIGSSAAVWASFVLAVLPSYLSHFIFAASWGVTLFWPAIYVLGKTVHNPRLWAVLAFVVSGVFLVQPISAAVFFVFFVLFVLFQKNRPAFLKALLFALVLSGTYWAYVFAVFGFSGVSSHLGFGMVTGPGDTSEGIMYGFRDFVFASANTRIDAPSGWGVMVTFLLVYSVFFRPLRWIVAWLAVSILGIEGNFFPAHLWPHRMWQYAAVPVVLLSGLSAHALCSRLKKYQLFAVLIVIGLVVSAGLPKFLVNTSLWQRGPEWASYNEANGYASLQKLSSGLTILAPCAPDWKVVANNQVRLDATVKVWNSSIILAQAKNLSADLVVFDESCVVQGFIDEKNLTTIIQELLDNTLLVSQNPGFVALSVVNAKK